MIIVEDQELLYLNYKNIKNSAYNKQILLREVNSIEKCHGLRNKLLKNKKFNIIEGLDKNQIQIIHLVRIIVLMIK